MPTELARDPRKKGESVDSGPIRPLIAFSFSSVLHWNLSSEFHTTTPTTAGMITAATPTTVKPVGALLTAFRSVTLS
jgi:hypothetical protein